MVSNQIMEFGRFLYFTREGSYFGQKTKGLLELLKLLNEMLFFDAPEVDEQFEKLYTDAVGKPPPMTFRGYYDEPQIFFESKPGGAVQYVGGFNDLERFIRNANKMLLKSKLGDEDHG